MDPEHMARLQRQMVQNQQEMQDYLKDLDSWTGDIKEKDETLKKETNSKGEDPLPPVRNSLDKKKKKKKKKPLTNGEKKKKPIKAYDFRSWDKFDVDKACAEIDAKSLSDSSDYETDEEWEEHRKKQQAIVYKDQGNQYFKEQKYDEAIECYTRGMQCDPQNALLPANRAMALLKQEKYGAAEFDCTQAIAIDPTYVKAFSRRGTARLSLNKLQGAMEDFSAVLQLEPGNKLASAEVTKIDTLLKPPAEVQTLEIDGDAGIVKPIYKPPSQRSKKPLRRVHIEEIGHDRDGTQRRAVQEIKSSQSKTTQDLTARDEELFHRLTGKEEASQNSPQVSSAAQGPEDLKLNLSEITQEDTEKSETTKKLDPVVPKKSVKSPPSSTSSTPTTSPRIPPVPSTSFQFQTDYKSLKNHPDKFYQYFKDISPDNYVKLFGECLESDIFMGVMNTLRDFYLPADADVFSVLSSLVNVKRFSMTTMFMSNKDKEVVRSVFSHLHAKGEKEDSVKQLEKKFQL